MRPSQVRSRAPRFRSSRALTRLMVMATLITFGSLDGGRIAAGGAAVQDSPDGIWLEVPQAALPAMPATRVLPAAYRAIRADRARLLQALGSAPREGTAAAATAPLTLLLPLPDGNYGRFQVEESPVSQPGPDGQAPSVRTYIARGLDDPTASGRLDWTPAGFHGFILSAGDTVYIDPIVPGDTEYYMSYYKGSVRRDPQDPGWSCNTPSFDDDPVIVALRSRTPRVVNNGGTLRTYRIALAATGEYTAAFGSQAAALAAIKTMINRINAIYERDLAVRLILLADASENLIIHTDPNTDPYTAGSLGTQNQTSLDNLIGTANYDLGHVVTVGGGGVAAFGVCDATVKGDAFSGGTPTNPEPFAVDLVAHEIGHQFTADHTFNDGASGSCTASNRSGAAAYEPASGSTIMAYGGICSPSDLVENSHDNFHVRSLEQMSAFITDATTGGSCGTAAATGNTVPTVNVGANVTIPKQTPFALTATASDTDNDTLTYSWEEYDLGLASPPNNDADGQPRPIFRAYAPVTSATRTFPSLQYILNNANVPPATYACGGSTCVTGEILPAIARTMQFQAVVRDSRTGGGAVRSAQAQVQVDAASGPFRVTAPNTAGASPEWAPLAAGGSPLAVTWDAANTASAPVSAANVKISLSSDGGTTFPFVLAASTPNDGSETVTLPNVATTQARVKVEAVGNIFFDVSDVNFTITASGCTYSIDPTTQAAPAGGGNFTANVTTQAGCGWSAASNTAFLTVTSGATGTGSGTVGYSAAANGTASARSGTLTIAGQTLTVNQAAAAPTSFTYYLAEGATGPFFDLELALANPNSAAATVAIQYLKEGGSTENQALTLGAQSRQTILVDSLTGLTNTAVSSVVTSNLPIAVERTMTWDTTFYGAHTEKATPGTNTTWYFAEGSEQGLFDTYLLLANPQNAANRATVQFLIEGGSPITKIYNLLPTSRTNVFAGDVEEPAGTKVLLNKAFGIVVTFDQPGVAERAMYFGATPFWNGGHESAGVNAPSTSWFHAEGATGAFFDTFILLSNPGATDATVTLRFLLDSGGTVTKTKTVPANARLTVNVESEDALLANAAMATQVTSTVPIVSERAMYWAQYPNWYEAHNAFGVTATGLKWALAEGRVGGATSNETYILLANPGTTAATVTVTYLREGGLAPITQTYPVAATSRFNIYANTVPGLGAGERFGALIESTVPIAVERAVYGNSSSQPGVTWASGTDATATPLP